MSLTPEEIREILRVLQESDWDSAEVTVGDVTLSVSRNGMAAGPAPTHATAAQPVPVAAAAPAATPVPAAAPTPPAAVNEPPIPDPSTSGEHVVSSPTVGVFWRSPSPGAPPFVEVGSTVAVGDTLCIVEVMKLMSNVTSDVAGIVTAVHVENSASVEFGSPLFSIKAE